MTLQRSFLLLLAPFVGIGAQTFEPIRFEPNHGQADAGTRFLARIHGALMRIGDRTLEFSHSSAERELRLQVEFVGASAAGAWQALEPARGTTSYILGNRPERWVRDVPHFGRLLLPDLYPGIDLVVYSQGGDPEYDLVLHPGADPRRIRLRFAGERSLSIDGSGNLAIDAGSGRLVQKKPVLYEIAPDGSHIPVDGAWRLAGRHAAAFHVGAHHAGRPMVVDPVLVSATYLGAEGDDRIIGGDAHSLIIGTTTSTGFPGIDTAKHRGTDIFVYNAATGSTSIIGGSGDDIVTCAHGGGTSALIGGYTNSRDLPLPQFSYGPGSWPAPIQTQYGGGDWDGFVLAVQFGNVIEGTYIGGSGDDRVLAVDSASYLGFAAAGSTTSTDFPLAAAWQTSPGGATDGFLTVMNGSGTVVLSTYLGGSADDRALAVGVSNADLYVGGVTASNDWNMPGTWSGSRAGATDAFLLHVTAPDINWSRIQAVQGLYFGGSGDDRIGAVAVMPNGNVAAAGTTSSGDIAFPNAAQPAYGGGDSDAFAAQFSPALQLVQGTYIGGSGAEEALALAASAFDEMLVGGWTNSPDFPATAAAVSACGNGPSDAFLTHLDSAGQPVYATCYGGSGSDRITSVASDGAQTDYFAGYSDSADLPTLNPVQPANGGGIDGFFAALSVPVIHVEGVTGGRDLASPLTAVLGDPTNFVGTPLTIASGDPTQVLIGTQPDDPGQPAATIAASADPTFTTRRALIYCLTDNANVPLTVSAPGYPSRTVPARCVPSGLYVSPAPAATAPNASIAVLPAALDPNTLQPIAYQNPRAGVGPISISLNNPDPSFVAFSTTSVTIDSFSNLQFPNDYPYPVAFPYQVSGSGSVDITFSTTSSFAFVPSNTAHIRGSIGPALSFYVPVMARDLMAPISANFGGYGPTATIPVTFTSSDASKVRLMTDPSQPGQASVTANYSSLFAPAQAWIEVLDTSGPASITATADGSNPVTANVAFGNLTTVFVQGSSGVLKIPLTVGLPAASVTLQLQVAPYLYAGSTVPYELRKGAAPVQVQVTNSGPAVATGPNFSATLATPGSGFVSIPTTITPVAAGTAVVAVAVTSGAAVAGPPLTVTVAPGGFNLSGPAVGGNLMSAVNVWLGGKIDNSTVPVTLTVSNPALALLSTDQSTPGQASVTLAMPYINGQAYIQALASSGSVDITATAPGFGTAKTTIPLVPSGIAFTAPSVAVPVSGFAPNLAGYALDPVTLVPTVQQQVRPGLSGSLALQVADPSIAVVSPASVPLSAIGSGNVSLTFTAAGTGTTQVSFTQPGGFIQPAGHGALQVNALGPAVSLQPGTIARNGQAGLTINVIRWASGTPPALTLTSSDPTKLLLSTSAYGLGSASVTVNLAGQPTYPSTPPVFMNAIDGPADVQITATGAGIPPVTVNVPIGSMGLGLAMSYQGSPAVTSTQSGSLPVNLVTLALNSLGGVTGSVTLRPGLDSVPVTINSSNAAVGTVPTSPILNSLTNSSPFNFKPMAPGQTDLSIALPPGYLAAPPSGGRTLHVTVNGASFAVSDFALGRDLELGVQMNVMNGSGAIPADVDAVLTSSDPTRLVLSPEAATPGAGSITIHFNRGDSPSRLVYAQALDQSGTVSFTITANGYSSTTTNVTLYPTGFITNGSGSFGTTIGNPPLFVPLYAIPAMSQRPNNTGNYQFRPGVTPSISAAASPAGIVNVSPASTTWPAGARELDFNIQATAPGSTTLAFTVPAPYAAPQPIPITVGGGTFNVIPSGLALGYNLQDTVMIYTGQANVNVTVSSSDPSRVLLSASPTTPGQASVTLSSSTSQNVSVYVQALAATGTVTLTFSAPNYQTTTSTVQLMSSAVELISPYLAGTLTPLSAPLTFQAKVLPYSGPNSSTYSTATVRPGAALSVQATMSDPTIAAVTPAQIVFAAGSATQSFNVQPTAPGSALLSLSVPAGYADPVSLRQQLLTVVSARAVFSSALTVGKDLARSTFLTLSSAVGSPVEITLTSSDPTRLLLANSAYPNGAASVTVTVPAGSSAGSTVSMIGLAASGTVNLAVSAPGLTATNNTVTLEPSGFAFGNPATSATVNSRILDAVQIYSLNPQTLAPDTALTLRPGLAPVSVSFTSSNPSVIPSPADIFFNAGGPGVNISSTALSAGSTTLTIQTPPGFTTPSTGNTVTITVH